jgi:DNA-binding CsgD family transcriptional regulator
VAEVAEWDAEATASQPAPKANVATTTAATPFNLTDRELEVLRLLVDGKSSKEIADALYISPRTATTHVGNILAKLGVNSRSAAVAIAFQHNIV